MPLRGPAPRILAGPERLETGWWDGGDVRRDYYVVETAQGQRALGVLRAGRAGRLDAAWVVRMSAYAELHCLSNFTFGRGASSARELFERAKACGYSALAITDECSLAGIVRALEASRATGVKLIVGAEFQLDDGPKLVLLCETQDGYTALCELITRGRRASAKGTYRLHSRRSRRRPAGHVRVVAARTRCPISRTAAGCAHTFGERAVAGGGAASRPGRCAAPARTRRRWRGSCELPLVAAGDVHMHVRRRRPCRTR